MIDTLGLSSTVNMGLMLNITGGILMAAAVISVIYFICKVVSVSVSAWCKWLVSD